MNLQEIAKHYVEIIVPSNEFQQGGVCGNLDLLFPLFKVDVMKLLANYKEFNGDNDVPYVLESYRSHTLQSAYYFRGASKIKGGNILNAGMHHFGIAVDIVNLKDKNGNGTKDLNEAVDWNNLDYTLLRKLADRIGLVSLSWELCHFQDIKTTEQQELRNAVYYYVKDWQKKNGLKPDGIIGKISIAKARELYN